MKSQTQLTASSPITFVDEDDGVQPPRVTFSRKGMGIGSVLLVALGSGLVTCGIVRIFLDGDEMKFAGEGIWCGVLMIIPGILIGILAYKRKNKCLIISCMVMSLLASIASVSLLVISSASLDSDSHAVEEYSSTKREHRRYWTAMAMAFEIVEIVFGTVTFVVSILLSAICCRVTGCGSEEKNRNQRGDIYEPEQEQETAQTPFIRSTYSAMPVGAPVNSGGSAGKPNGQSPV